MTEALIAVAAFAIGYALGYQANLGEQLWKTIGLAQFELKRQRDLDEKRAAETDEWRRAVIVLRCAQCGQLQWDGLQQQIARLREPPSEGAS